MRWSLLAVAATFALACTTSDKDRLTTNDAGRDQAPKRDVSVVADASDAADEADDASLGADSVDSALIADGSIAYDVASPLDVLVDAPRSDITIEYDVLRIRDAGIDLARGEAGGGEAGGGEAGGPPSGGLFAATPSSIDLGTLPVGAAAAPVTVTITALSALSDLTVATTGGELTIDTASTCTTSLAASASCAVVVKYLAATTGNKSEAVVISAGGARGKTVIVAITANVVAAQ
jgi:hypothetical protein